jgi:hypothetical protein
MGVMWVDGEVREGEGYFSHLDFQSGYTGRHASASALGFGFAGRTNGSSLHGHGGSALVGGNGLEFGVERHMLQLSFRVILYGISCDTAAATS